MSGETMDVSLIHPNEHKFEDPGAGYANQTL